MISLPHTIEVRRDIPTGAFDEYNQSVTTEQLVFTRYGWLQWSSGREALTPTDAGPLVQEGVLYTDFTDGSEEFRTGDRVTCLETGDLAEVRGVRDAAGINHHLEVIVRRVDRARV